jgi:hypothetical protein
MGDLDIDVRTMFKKRNVKEIACEGVNWIELAQDRDQWRATVNKVINFQVRDSSLAQRLSVSQERLFFMKVVGFNQRVYKPIFRMRWEDYVK